MQDAEGRPSKFNWEHEPHGSFIRGAATEVSLLFDSAARLWRLRICKKKTSLGHPIAYKIAFKERYSPTPAQAISLANIILDVELQD
ncbi:MAG TPA: hypothetical protein VFO40_04465 [Chthoniobacterales bacterium]|nr:hypothetical protein [Chthoniobacterales bacterium]